MAHWICDLLYPLVIPFFVDTGDASLIVEEEIQSHGLLLRGMWWGSSGYGGVLSNVGLGIHPPESCFHWLKLDLMATVKSFFPDEHGKGQEYVQFCTSVQTPEVCVNVWWCCERFWGLQVTSSNPVVCCCSGFDALKVFPCINCRILHSTGTLGLLQRGKWHLVWWQRSGVPWPPLLLLFTMPSLDHSVLLFHAATHKG